MDNKTESYFLVLVPYTLKMAEGTAVTISSIREYFDRVNILVINFESGVHPYITGIRGVVSFLDKEKFCQRDLNNFGHNFKPES